jgi:hypothetical protein
VTVGLPAMAAYQAAAWHALMDLHESLPEHWTIVGGQMVTLHCAERKAFPVRPTDDADALLDVKASPTILEDFTEGLLQAGFKPVISGSGRQHRWRRGETQVDVLISDKLGNRKKYVTTAGAPTVGTPGAALVLKRSEDIAIDVAGRTGTVRRPTLIGSLVAKAAAHTLGEKGDRHRQDFAVLASILSARDLRESNLTSSENKYLIRMLDGTLADPHALALTPGAQAGLARLQQILPDRPS